jgi:phenylacetate-CoA ligase
MKTTLRDRLHGRLLMPLAYRMLGDRRFDYLHGLLERDTWSPQRVQEHQAQRLTELYRVCMAHNEYWREKFQEYGLNPGGADPLSELNKLPVLTKDELRANWRRMRSTHLADREVVHETSSGSTGMQVNVYQSRHYRQFHAAMEYRSRLWMGIAPGEPFLQIGAHGAQAHMKRKARVLRWFRMAAEQGTVIDAFHIDPQRTGALLRRVADHGRIVHVHGYTTSLVTVARLAQQMGLKWPSMKAVSSTAEQLFEQDRQLLQEAFGAPVYDRYGSREVQSISMQCPEGRHHIYTDCNVVEFLDLEGADDGSKAIVVTPLDNEAMPLFRYRNGDSASAVEGRCPCGRSLPLMTACLGRICNNFITPDGRIINGTYFLYYFYYQEGFKSYQFHQTTPQHIDLYVVPDGQLSGERRAYLERSCQKIRNDYDSQFEVDLHIVDQIPRTPGGKHLYTVSDVLKNV